ncbi:MAG: DUF6090 family protein [Bacteroidota bacterium]
MFRLFRQIRQVSISRNSFSKYFLYAVGEILLVVVGILIALQINDWSEVRKDRREEIELLQNITNNLQSDIHQIERITKATKNRLTTLDSTVAMLRTPERMDTAQFFQNAFAFGVDSYFTCNSGIFDEAVSSGKMSLIQDNELSEDLFRYYQNAKENLQDGTTRKVTDETVTPRVIEHVFLNKTAQRISNSLFADIMELEEMDFKALRSNKDFWIMYSTKNGYNTYQLMTWQGLSKAAKELQINIKKELKKLE